MALLDRILDVFRDRGRLHLKIAGLSQAARSSRDEVRTIAQQSSLLNHWTFAESEYVGVACQTEALCRLTPIPLRAFKQLHRKRVEEFRRTLEWGVAEGLFHLAGDRLERGPGDSLPVECALPGYVEHAPPVVMPGGVLDEQDMGVLGHLEDIEAGRINFGLYATYVSEAELLSRLPAEFGLNAGGLRDVLRRLEEHGYLLRLPSGHLRSRISEMVRVLKQVKQRFRADDAHTAPYLIRSVRVRFEDRRRLRRDVKLHPIVTRVFHANRKPGSELDRARKAVEAGFAAVVKREVAEVDVTPVQARTFAHVASRYINRTGGGFVVTGNTGSGKTEAVLLPLLLGAVEARLREVKGCKVILVYPRQELAKNQMQRLCEYLARINAELRQLPGGAHGVLTAGIVFGETPINLRELTEGKRHRDGWKRGGWTRGANGWQLPYFAASQGGAVSLSADLHDGVGSLAAHHGETEREEWRLDGFRATREAVLTSPPDVLVVTTEMLHRWLMNPAANALFGLPSRPDEAPRFAAPRAVVFDEIHLYDTIHGAQVGLLIQRLRHRLREAMKRDVETGWEYPLVVGMSATIGDPAHFWSRLSGVPESHVKEIAPQQDDLEAAQGREHYLFIRPETYSRGKLVGDASAAIQSIMVLSHNLRRRAAEGTAPAKFRSLVFQDSISRLKKLTVEFHDAETNRFLAGYRLHRPAGPSAIDSVEFREGEYWTLDADDALQYGTRRQRPGVPAGSLSSHTSPAYSGSKGTHLLDRDIVFATSVLEVGYDDPSIQLVFQHHAPRNAASFVQKKGRGGRSLNDRPVTAVTLSQHSFRDAFFYQNPKLLYDPDDYRPPLNVENYFVQRFQSLALLFDELTRITGEDLASWPRRTEMSDAVVRERLQRIGALLQEHAGDFARAYRAVTAESFRRVHPNLRDVWRQFCGELANREIRHAILRRRSLLHAHPELPQNLFSSINLPTLRVTYPPDADPASRKWKIAEEDISLALSEVAPGRVTRRYGGRHLLLWRPPYPTVALERYKENRGDRGPGPFDPERLHPTEQLWGENWERVLPVGVGRLYPSAPPEQFYRARYLELHTFGELDPRNPKEPQPSWMWWGELLPDGSVWLTRTVEPKGPPIQKSRAWRRDRSLQHSPWRQVSPDSSSYPLSFSYARPARLQGEPAPEFDRIILPPLFPGLLKDFRLYCGELDGRRSALEAWEVYYGAEAQVRLIPLRRNDPHAGTGTNLVRYDNEHDGRPTLYGYDMVTEGLRVPYAPDAVRATAEQVIGSLSEGGQLVHLQEQFVRYLLKSGDWPKEGLASPLTSFDRRRVADLITTLRAHHRAEGFGSRREFVGGITTSDGLARMLAEVKAHYWRDERMFSEDFVARLQETLTHPPVRDFLLGCFRRPANIAELTEYVQVTLLHSLKHAVRHLFVTEGSTRDEEVGSFGVFKLTHAEWAPEHDFYVFERNHNGSGAARLVHQVVRRRGPMHLLARWWDVTLACPVGDEEEFIRAVIRTHGGEIAVWAVDFFARSPQERESPLPMLRQWLNHLLPEEHAFVQEMAGIITAEVALPGGRQVPRVFLQLEIQAVEEALRHRFRRPPTPNELAGYALTQVQAPGGAALFPHLAELLALYGEHQEALQYGDLEDTAAFHDRFLDQVQHLSLLTCVDACPACLASDCDTGHIDTMRHTLSRRLLKVAHRILTEPMTVQLAPGLTLAEVDRVADAHDGWAILTHARPIPPALAPALRARYEDCGRIFDYERLEMRSFLRRREEP